MKFRGKKRQNDEFLRMKRGVHSYPKSFVAHFSIKKVQKTQLKIVP